MGALFYYLCGTGYNLLARAATPPTITTADSLFSDPAALSDYSQDVPLVFTAASETKRVDVDLNQVPGHDFDETFVSGLPAGTGWSKSGSATITRETTSPFRGSAYVRVDGSIGQYLAWDQEVVAGETLTLEIAMRGSAIVEARDAAVLRGRNLATGRWLNQGMAWQAGGAFAVTNPSTAWAYNLRTFTVEDYATCQTDRPVIRWYLATNIDDVDGYCEFDAFAVWPSVSMVSIHGHNVPPGATLVRLGSGVVDDVFQTRVDPVVTQPTMWATFTMAADRYWRLSITEPADGRQVYLREFVLAQLRALMRQREDGAEETLIDPQDRSESGIGAIEAHLLTERARRRLAVRLKFPSSTEMAEWREIMERSRNGAHPLWIVADSERADAAMLCRVAPEWARAHMIGTFHSSGADFDELPFPAMVA